MTGVLLLAVGLSIVQVVASLQCYICSFQYPGAPRDRACLDKPWNSTQGIRTMDCPYPYCIIYRQYMQATKQIHSFLRGCEMAPRGNKCVLDTYYSTCSYTCTTDLCNGGDGIPSGGEVGQEYIGPPAYNPANKRNNHRKKGKKENKKRDKKKKKIECFNPYNCDQSKYWKQDSGSSVPSAQFSVVLGLAYFVLFLWYTL